MAEKLAETIRRISREHLEKNNGLLFGQCLTAVGWVGGTVPEMGEKEGVIELSMDDTSAGYLVSGAASELTNDGKRPIYLVRYQGFQWFNAVGIANYAAKSKEMWNIPCPVFVRSIGMDAAGRKGRAIGPVASGSHHSIYHRMPGIPIAAPMTPKEYESVWNFFMSHEDPVYVSEHRRGWEIDYEMDDIIEKDADITLMPISSTRLNAIDARKILEKEGVKCNLVHLLWIKPFKENKKSEGIKYSLANSKYGGLILDGDYTEGVAKCLAYDLMHEYDKKIYALGLEQRTAGFAPQCDNLPPPPEKICNYVKSIIKT